jgi:glutamate N-acetyltransferase/amino-acid N-acetyltransferase
MSTVQIQVIPDGSITSTPGFEAAGVACGLKAGGALDLALAYSPQPCVGAAVFTTNAFRAAPVLYDEKLLGRNRLNLHGVVINSGCANACTGAQGLRDAAATAAAAASHLGIDPSGFMVMSTGVIGMPLPMDKVLAGVVEAAAQRSHSLDAGHSAARAIMTTDTRPKEVALRVTTSDGEFTIAGMAKGAGMIHPNMATMLCLVTTDVRVEPAPAQKALRHAVDGSLNMVTVDGDTSTNDTALLLANGLASMRPIHSLRSTAYHAFLAGLTQTLTMLAKAIVRDGEGATRFVEITVSGARTPIEAKQAAMSVARSLLVKTAIYGQNANWGRIICAVGYSGVPVDPGSVRVWLGDLELFRRGEPYEVDEARARELLARPEVPIHIDLGQGDSRGTVWTCDLSHRYVDINAHYRT